MPFVAALVFNARHYLPFLSDDALISLRYARRLIEGDGLTWTAGNPVEGYSNLLWILTIAVVGRLHVDLIHAARILGIVCMSVAMYASASKTLRRTDFVSAWFPLALSLFFFAWAAPIAVWSIGGLEQPLYAALIALSVLWLDRDWPLSFVLGLLCLTRPDGVLFAGAAALAVLLDGGGRAALSRAARVLTLPIAFSLLQSAFRLWYYHDVIPNTARVKLTPSGLHAAAGWRYVRGGFLSLSPLSWVALAGLGVLLITRDTRSTGRYLLLTGLIWCGYVVFIGGDIFPAYRHLVPLIVVLLFALSEGLTAAMSRLPRRPVTLAVTVVAGAALSVPYLRAQERDPQALRAVRERWEWQGRDLALTLRDAFGRQHPTIAVTAAGCLPYWTEFPAIDMMGLNDAHIARHPPADVGQGPLGHEFGDGRYVLSRAPDLIVFTVGSTPMYRSGVELDAIPEFHLRYVPVRLRVNGFDEPPLVYMDKYSDRIGIHYAHGAVDVPAFVFRDDTAVAAVDTTKRLIVILPAGSSVRATLAAATVPASGDVEVDANDPSHVTSTVERTESTVTVTLRSTSDAPIDIRRVVLRASR